MSKQPIEKLKDGPFLSATIWKNIGEDGKVRYSTTLSRSYMKDDEWREANSYSSTELLRMSRLAQRAYDRLVSIAASDKAAQQEAEAAA